MTQQLKQNHQAAIKLLDAIDEMENRRKTAINQIAAKNGTVFYTEEYLNNLADTRQKAINRLWQRYYRAIVTQLTLVP